MVVTTSVDTGMTFILANKHCLLICQSDLKMQYLAKYAERRIFCLKTTETISVIVKMISAIDWIIPTIGKVIRRYSTRFSQSPRASRWFPKLFLSFRRTFRPASTDGGVHRWVVK